ncbi:MAG: class I SAM-dependent methyltransferase [Bryobacteraceae bacterium]
MAQTATSDLDYVRQHREIWELRPELRAVYHGFFATLLEAAGGRRPIVELGAGPGFFREYFPESISTDVIFTPWVDVVCDGCRMPFREASAGAVVMLDVIHHLPRPLDFLAEVGQILRPGGRLVAIEPWITPPSYILYRYFHHEDCTLSIDIAQPFRSTGKQAFDGNAAIPYQLVRRLRADPVAGLKLVRCEPFLALAYLATLGFKRQRSVPVAVIRMAEQWERIAGPLGRLASTRALLVWAKV